jgi:transposase-like protein
VALNGFFLLVSNEDEISRICGTHGREAYFMEVWWKNLEESASLRT